MGIRQFTYDNLKFILYSDAITCYRSTKSYKCVGFCLRKLTSFALIIPRSKRVDMLLSTSFDWKTIRNIDAIA